MSRSVHIAVAVVLATPLLAVVAEARRSAPKAPASVELYRGPLRVRAQPTAGAPIRGQLADAGRFPVLRVLPPGHGCKERWYQLGPEAWVCSGWLLPRKLPPTAIRRIESTWTPGAYFGTRTGRWKRLSFFPSMRQLAQGKALRLRGTIGFSVRSRILLRRQTYLVTGDGGYVESESVARYPSTSLVGVTIRGPRELPLAFALRNAVQYAVQRGQLRASGRTLKRYSIRTVKRLRTVGSVEVVELSAGGLVLRQDVALASRPPAPPLGVGPKEQWVDVDAAERLVFAMRGRRVERVMLTSLGTNTPRGVFRVQQKLVHKTMRQRLGDDPFYLEAVPYVVFWSGDFGFHGAYWHDGFGTRLSHGCPNLSLADARFVFGWLGPKLPAGFLSIRPTAMDLGGVVRVRGRYAVRPGEPRPAPPRRRHRPRQ
ncbi:MAG: L,D-transpeptidase [bacterium]